MGKRLTIAIDMADEAPREWILSMMHRIERWVDSERSGQLGPDEAPYAWWHVGDRPTEPDEPKAGDACQIRIGGTITYAGPAEGSPYLRDGLSPHLDIVEMEWEDVDDGPAWVRFDECMWKEDSRAWDVPTDR